MNQAVISPVESRFKKLKKPIFKAAQLFLKELRCRSCYLEVYLVADKQMDKDVLAFPAPKDLPRPDVAGRFLGEIYLNPDQIIKETLPFDLEERLRFQGRKILSAKLAYMLIHGLLHLLGHDHQFKRDRVKMEKKEKHLLNIFLVDHE